MDLKEIGELLQNRRTFLKLSQEDVAEITNVTIRTIYSIENGKSNPSISTLQKIADVLGMEIIVRIKNLENG